MFVKLKAGADPAWGSPIPDVFGDSAGDHGTYPQDTKPGGG